MKTITTSFNWHEIDFLGKTPLEDGERLRLRWPDGTVETVNITVEKTTHTISDMGTPYDMPIWRAFVTKTIHGHPVRVRIAGLEAERK